MPGREVTIMGPALAGSPELAIGEKFYGVLLVPFGREGGGVGMCEGTG